MPNARTALVTGANKGIGLQIAKDLAAHGFSVLVGSRSREAGDRAAESVGADARAVELDVTSQASITAAAQRIDNEVGHLDVLVNNAGVSHAGGPGRTLPEIAASNRISVVSLDDVRRVWETNVFGIVAVTQAMLPLLRKAPAARIVNIGSGGGSLAANSDPENPHRSMFGNYSASKSAVNAITLAFAIDLEPEGIKVNAADPGFTQTDLNDNQGTGTVEAAAREPVRLALLGADGQTGTFSNNDGVVPW